VGVTYRIAPQHDMTAHESHTLNAVKIPNKLRANHKPDAVKISDRLPANAVRTSDGTTAVRVPIANKDDSQHGLLDPRMKRTSTSNQLQSSQSVGKQPLNTALVTDRTTASAAYVIQGAATHANRFDAPTQSRERERTRGLASCGPHRCGRCTRRGARSV
jgi:hypothetical protein